jgi:hypothetical protein
LWERERERDRETERERMMQVPGSHDLISRSSVIYKKEKIDVWIKKKR